MKTTIDRAGRVVIPKEIRAKAGLVPGSEIEVRSRDGIIEISASPPQGRLVQEGSLLVWEPAAGTAQFGVQDVNRAMEELREERERDILEGGH